MELTIKNIAKIKNAKIELNGITVIAGENDTGKSTVSKVLYSVFNSFYDIDKHIQRERVHSISGILEPIYSNYVDGFYGEESIIVKKLLEFLPKEKLDINIIKTTIEEDLLHGENVDYIDDEEIAEATKRVKEVLDIPDKEILKNIISNYLNTEFNYQINNIYHDGSGEIELKIKNNLTSIVVSDDYVSNVENICKLKTEAIYVDDPFVIDGVGSRFWWSLNRDFMSHRDHLKIKLRENITNATNIGEIIVNNKLEKIYSKINLIFDGEVVNSKRSGLQFVKNGSKKSLNIKNISTGLKTFVILKNLLEKGVLEYNGTIILDEPEIHLHPQWQLLLAEIIVLIQKEFNMHVLINTHSPYFLQAIEVYSSKYEIADKCKYYLALMEDDVSVIDDVTDVPEKIYELLAKPFNDLENARYSYD